MKNSKCRRLQDARGQGADGEKRFSVTTRRPNFSWLTEGEREIYSAIIDLGGRATVMEVWHYVRAKRAARLSESTTRS